MWGRKIQPEKFLPECLNTNAKFGAKKRPFHLSDNVVLNLSRERQQLHQAEQSLKEKREYYTKAREDKENQWQEIAETGRSIRNNFEAFNEFLVGNHQKRQRVVETIKSVQEFGQRKQAAVDELLIKLAQVQQFLDDLNAGVKTYSIYEKYLDQVIDLAAGQNLKDRMGIVEHHYQYRKLELELATRQAETFEVLQKAKNELAKLRENGTETLLALRTQMVGLQGRYDETARKSRRLDIMISRIITCACDKWRDVVFTKAAIWNQYVLMCRIRGLRPKYNEDDVEHQLLFIKRILRLMRIVNDTAEIKVQK